MLRAREFFVPPSGSPDVAPAVQRLTFDALHLPASRRAESGDRWCEWFAVADDRIVVALGERTANAAAAAVIGQLRRLAAGAEEATPARLLSEAAALLRLAGSAGEPAMIVGIVDRRRESFSYVAMGTPSPFLRFANGTVAALPAVDVAATPSASEEPLTQVTVDLRGVSRLVLFTAGLVDTATTRASGLGRLRHVLEDDRLTACDQPARWLLRRMIGDRAHEGISLLTIEFPVATAARAADLRACPCWSAAWSFDATAAASNEARRAFLACLQTPAADDPAVDLGAAELIYGELLGNVVRHAPGRVDVRLDWTAERAVLHVIDNGPGFRSRRRRERLPVDDLSESGRGLFIINAYAAGFSVHNRKGRGTHATATLMLKSE